MNVHDCSVDTMSNVVPFLMYKLIISYYAHCLHEGLISYNQIW